VQVSAPAGGIDRLFVAVPVPADLAGELARLQPPAAAGVRLSQAADMHVTLHFLGNTQADPVRQALAGVRATARFSSGAAAVPAAHYAGARWSRRRT
jgi:2'-5' RNA ligase